MPNIKRKNFFKTLMNDFFEYILQTVLLGLTAVTTAFFSDTRFIDILGEQILNDTFLRKLCIYLSSLIILSLSFPILATAFSIFLNRFNIFVRNKIKNFIIIFNNLINKNGKNPEQEYPPQARTNTTNNKTTAGETSKKIGIIKKYIQFSSPLLFKRAGSTIANSGSVMLLTAPLITFMYYFPSYFNFNEEETKTLKDIGKDLNLYCCIALIYFSISILWKSFSTVYIEESIKQSKSKTES
jgi:hypothetical protein